jgi:hypothetical protein
MGMFSNQKQLLFSEEDIDTEMFASASALCRAVGQFPSTTSRWMLMRRSTLHALETKAIDMDIGLLQAPCKHSYEQWTQTGCGTQQAFTFASWSLVAWKHRRTRTLTPSWSTTIVIIAMEGSVSPQDSGAF